MTVPIGIAEFISQFDIRWGEVMATSTLATIPVMLFVLHDPEAFRPRPDGWCDQGVGGVMDTYSEEAREIPITHRAEAVVVGGGVGRKYAAIASARTGADTLLVERYGALGGNLTIGLLEAIMSFHDRKGNQIIRGIPDEIVQRLKAEGGSIGHVEDDMGYCGTVTPYDPEELKMVCLNMTQESGVRLLLHTSVAGAIVEESQLAVFSSRTNLGGRGSGDKSLWIAAAMLMWPRSRALSSSRDARRTG